MVFEKSGSAGYLANHMARLFALGLQDRIRPLGLAPAQFMLLIELWREDGLSQRDLVERLDVEQATIANTLARMERDGLITRAPHQGDARMKLIRLTPKARRIEAEAIAAARAQNAAALGDLTQAEREQFLDMMRRVITRMQARGERAERRPSG
ncbi:MarR family transcriptional regulator [Mesorhizobium sp. L-8-10]|uniref:MarR family winged helix-turn-helix transcriptional regulator n=1 Tax=unclassified Mesorhizobium TaxID=325217 RepID=UPI001927871E|nr:MULTISPECIES: MarR family transcriptional regulator [unclassified Mesorhizobium]BCH24158.1 MarR family transcriptional regulator [Mesorhizobium sp. L-8-3]BCH31892.1 MarR family transcriptional regulator [Mesorhizobium sp. L-8-10]